MSIFSDYKCGAMDDVEFHNACVEMNARDRYENYDDDLVVDLDEEGEQEPCDDAISREAVKEQIKCWIGSGEYRYTNATEYLIRRINNMPSVHPSRKGHCKDCKYFEYDSVAKVDGIPLIVAHEICNKWGNGCKTREDGYCFLFEPQESEDKE